MGTKFAHFSISDSSIDQTIGLLNLIPKRPNIMEIMKRVAPDNELFNKPIEQLKKPENQSDEQWQKFQKDWSKATKYMNSQKRTYYVGQNLNWTTVFSEEFGFESIDVYTLSLSKNTDKLFFTIGLFDEDVFTFSVIKQGKILTHHVSGSAEIYGMKQSLGDSAIFAETFNIAPRKEQLEQILKTNDKHLDKKITGLENLVSVKLWLNRSAPRELRWKKVIL